MYQFTIHMCILSIESTQCSTKYKMLGDNLIEKYEEGQPDEIDIIQKLK